MGTVTQESIIAGFQPQFRLRKAEFNMPVSRPFSTWLTAGTTGTGVAGSGLNGQSLSSTAAQVPGSMFFKDSDQASGVFNYLAVAGISHQVSSLIEINDRLWHNSFVTTITTLQSITTPTWPSRDEDGLTLGKGLEVGIEFVTSVGANLNGTLIYTNSAGVAGRSTTFTGFPNGTNPGLFFRIPLAGADIGIRSIQSIQLSAANSGSASLVVYRPILSVSCTANVPSVIDPLTGGMPRCYNGSVLWPMINHNVNLPSTFNGYYHFSHI